LQYIARGGDPNEKLVKFLAVRFVHRFAARYAPQWCSVHTGCFNALVSIGKFRKRLPVAAKTALVTAGRTAEVPASPIPPGGSKLWTCGPRRPASQKDAADAQPTPEIDRSLARLDRVYSR
jgi:hypothetical protein